MKKVFYGLFVLAFVLGMALLNVPQTVSAAYNSPLAQGLWQVPAPVTGTEMDVTSVGAPSYMTLLTTGVKTSAPAKICHQFQGARYNWVGEIRQWVDSSWVKVKTSTSFVPDEEGIPVACAQTYSAGTYALFAYYHVATVPIVPGNASIISEFPGSWNTGKAVEVDMVKNPAPSWLNIYSTGIMTAGSVEICHPFANPSSGLKGEIRQLVDGKWVKLATTFAWVPTEEGIYKGCATAPEAGTYVLFGTPK